MPGITGMGMTYDLPNFVGEIFSLSPSDTPLLNSIGGLTGGKRSTGTIETEWQVYDEISAAQDVAFEGADAPDADNRTRANKSNILQIQQLSTNISYTKLAAIGMHSGLNIAGVNPVQNEATFQLALVLKRMSKIVEYSFIRGIYNKPVNNTTKRKTRGLLEAITTNVIANAPATALTEAMILNLLQTVWDNGGIQESETATIICNSWQKRKLTEIFITNKNFKEQSRNVGGVNLMTIETDFGKLNIMLNRYMPTDQIAVASLEQLIPVLLEIPGKGFMFVEPLAKTGASEKSQVYGEIGLEYGNEKAHGKVTGLTLVDA